MSSLGQALKNSKKSKVLENRSHYRSMLDTERAIQVEAEAARYDKEKNNLKSIWETNDLDNFLAIADAREESYFAQRDVRVVIDGKVHIVKDDKVVPEITSKRKDWLKLSESLTIPHRPRWSYEMPAEVVQEAERKAFTDWRRSLAALEEEHKVVMTPYERNLEVWRQLWRVVERADIVVSILDARHPLIFRSRDFEAYVRTFKNSAGKPKRLILLMNKADLLTENQRREWAAYFESRGDEFLFFSAKPLEPANTNGFDAPDSDDEDEEPTLDAAPKLSQAQEKAVMSTILRDRKDKSRHKKKSLRAPVEVANAYELAEARRQAKEDANKPKPKIEKPLTEEEIARNARVAELTAAAAVPMEPWSVLDPEQLLDRLALLRHDSGLTDDNEPLMVGLVGYPNVGKSSTINALIGAKKVVVSATPGKTKHFQTLTIPNERRVALCDSPGLVFPSFASTKAQMVCDGILPADTVTNAMAAAAVVCRRIPRQILEEHLRISLLPEHDEDESDSLVERMLNAMARRRGYLASHHRPNKARAGKELLKMYVDGYFVYAEPPPTFHPKPEELALDTYLRDRGLIQDDDGDEEFEDWDSDEEEAWADLDDAEAERALSDIGDDDREMDTAVELAAPPMFYARPHGLRQTFTRQEFFNLEGNEQRIAARKVDKARRKKRTNHQLDPDEYTFVNRAGEVELRIDDDDGVVELVNTTAGPVRPTLGAAKTKHVSKRKERRELKKVGVIPGNPSTKRMGVQGY